MAEMSEQNNLIDQIEADAASAALSKKEKYSDPYFSRKSVIYFIAAGKNPIKAVKIGVTARNTVLARLRSIQSSNHERVALLGVIEYLDGEKPGLEAERNEAKLHKQFAELQRAKSWTVGAEWFNWEEPLVQFVQALLPLPQDLEKYSQDPEDLT